MKDIGSIFPIYSKDLIDKIEAPSYFDKFERLNLSLCREALLMLAEKYSYTSRKVLLPAYTCQSVIDPFVQSGWLCSFYNIKQTLRIDIESIETVFYSVHPDIILIHPYCGMDLNEQELDVLKKFKREKKIVIIEDLTQIIFSTLRSDIIDYYVGSYRKWFKIPDGAFIEKNLFPCTILEENGPLVLRQLEAMYLRGYYYENNDEIIKQISIRINKEAVTMAEKQSIKPHCISRISMSILKAENIAENQRRRISNFNFLFNYINNCNGVTSVIKQIKDLTTAPLYFPIMVQNRDIVQRVLAEQHIYAPLLWPVRTEGVLINDNIRKIYNNILMIPVDQRYDEIDMKKIIDVLNS